MNPCEEYELLLSARLDGALSLKEETQLHAHLAQCPHCRQLAQELEEAMGRQWYFTFEDRLNQYWAWENQAYYLFGLNLRREILEGFQGEG